MIPLYDNNPTRRFPIITVLLIAANVAVFLYIAFSAAPFQQFIVRYGAVPAFIVQSGAPAHGPLPPGATIFTAMFMHAGFFHLAGNMLFLWIFGNNVEDIQGRGSFLLFYLLCGVAAAAAHIYSDPFSAVPMVGASGAVSGVLAAYLLAFPRAQVYTLFWFVIFARVIPIPAVLFIGFWFLMQMLNMGSGGSVAWGAHIGGFVAGLLLAPVFRRRY